ncbi:MAG: hypothetical protein PWP65_1223 [Clostridia bacterium]|nr:hypothetical protein [Clostridia bacterium]
MRKLLKTLIPLMLAVFLFGQAAGPALAATQNPWWYAQTGEEDSHQKKPKIKQSRGQFKHQFKIAKGLKLRDIDHHWAREAIAQMSTLGVIQGYPDLTFQPEKPVTRLEALIMAVRALGLEEEALKAKDTPLAFKHAEQIPVWARGYVAVAVEQGLISEAELEGFRPKQPAKRYEVAMLMTRALGKDTEARLQVGDDLPFRDVAAIPEWARGYVRLALRYNLMLGDPDKAFRPQEPVKRCEMALLLLRLMHQNGMLDKEMVTGTIAGIGENSLTVTLSDGSAREIQLAEEVLIFKDRKKADLDALQTGDQVRIILAEDQAVFIAATSVREKVEAEGVIDAVYAGPPPTVSLKLKDGALKTFTIDAATKIVVDGERTSFEDLEPGQEAEIKAVNGLALVIKAEKAESEEGEEEEVSGTIKAVAFIDGQTTLTIIDKEGKERTFILAADAEIKIHGKKAAVALLKEGAKVEAEVKGDLVVKLNLEEVEEEETTEED